MIDGMLDLGPVEVNDFAEFWAAFPRHKDRARAEGAYRRARKVASAEEILSAARAYAASVAGLPAERTRWAVEWLRAEPWRPAAPPVAPRLAPRARRRSSKPRRAPHKVTRVRLTVEEQKAKWCRQHGITVAEYDARKHDADWVALIKRGGIVS